MVRMRDIVDLPATRDPVETAGPVHMVRMRDTVDPPATRDPAATRRLGYFYTPGSRSSSAIYMYMTYEYLQNEPQSL